MKLSLVFCLKKKTSYEMRISDWSSDVCSSDLEAWNEQPSVCPTPTASKGETHVRENVHACSAQGRDDDTFAGSGQATSHAAIIATVLGRNSAQYCRR